VIFTFYDTDTYDTVIYFGERLVKPFVGAFFCDFPDINQFEMIKQDVKFRCVRILSLHAFIVDFNLKLGWQIEDFIDQFSEFSGIIQLSKF
jgi:hypothetical protein